MRASCNPDEPVMLELPPLDLDEPEDDGPDERLEHPIEIDEGLAADRDAEPALDLDVGIELSDEDGTSSDAGELVLDIGQLLEKSDDEDEPGDPSALGPEHFDTASGLSELPNEPSSSSAVEGTDEPLGDLVSEQLPDLDADEEGVGDEPFDKGLVSLGVSCDEHEPAPWALERWSPVALPAARSVSMGDITLQDGRVLAAGDGVWSVSDGLAPLELADVQTTTLALVEGEPRTLLVATRDERLLKVEIDEDQTTCGHELNAPGDGAPLELSEASGAVLARSATGKLFSTRDAGQSWQLVDVGSRCLALARHASPLVALVHGRARPCLLRSNDAARSWQHVALDDAAESVALGQAPLLVADGCVVALADARQGMVVSDDGGASFKFVAHCFGATALATGTWAGRVRVWAALVSDLDGLARLVQVDPETAQATTLAELGTEGDGEALRVDALAWDAWGCRVWAGGAFGLLYFAPQGSH